MREIIVWNDWPEFRGLTESFLHSFSSLKPEDWRKRSMSTQFLNLSQFQVKLQVKTIYIRHHILLKQKNVLNKQKI